MKETIAQKLLNLMREYPALYEPSSAPFWDDAHISAQMLAAHLNPEWDAASRRMSFMLRSADWIAQRCGAGRRQLLDLGCGPGLYADLFAQRGFEAVGVDISERSVEYAKKTASEKRQNNRFLCKNYLDIDFRNEFDAAVLIYCDFGVLPPSDRALLLKKVIGALRPGGLFFLDGHSLRHEECFQEGETVEYSDGGFWWPQPYVCIERARKYRETHNILNQNIIITQDKCEYYNIWNQIFTGQSLNAELETAGFAAVELYDDIAGSEYTGQGKDLCAVGIKPDM